MGTSLTEYRGRGFWTRDAALETVLALLVPELEPPGPASRSRLAARPGNGPAICPRLHSFLRILSVSIHGGDDRPAT